MPPKKTQRVSMGDIAKTLASDAVVAERGDRSFRVPSAFPGRFRGDGYTIEAQISVVNGEARFAWVAVSSEAPMSPLQLQRLPWSQVLDAALEANMIAVDASGDGTWRISPGSKEAREVLRRTRRKDGVRESTGERQRVTAERLKEVMALKAEAQRLGERWDAYASKKTGLSRSYLRGLAGRAKGEETDGER